jgi:hypothetical protein
MYGVMGMYAQRRSGAEVAGKITPPWEYPSCSNDRSCGYVAGRCASGSAHKKKHGQPFQRERVVNDSSINVSVVPRGRVVDEMAR